MQSGCLLAPDAIAKASGPKHILLAFEPAVLVFRDPRALFFERSGIRASPLLLIA